MSEVTAEVTEPETTDAPDETEEQDAEQVEQDPAEPNLEPESEPDDEAQPEQQARSEEWWEKAWKASERENDRHTRRVSEIFEEEANNFDPCPMCTGFPAGWFLSEHLSDDHKELIRLALGDGAPEELNPMDGAAVCQKCSGHGRVSTPSLVPEERVKPCPGCNGLGWNYVPPPGAPPAGTYGLPPAPQENGTTIVEQPAFDAWSRPLGHPHYNIPPADVGI